MNPDKLFDYLEGRLPPAERTELEEKLMSDPQLRRQFDVAREIHRHGGKREVIGQSEDPAATQRSGVLTRRIATACIALVFLNVLFGIGTILVTNKKKKNTAAKEARIQQQFAPSLDAAARKALPVPSFVEGEIRITAPRADWDRIGDRIIAAASTFEGASATRGLAEKDELRVLVEIPSGRKEAFRQALNSVAEISPTPTATAETAPPATPPPNERTILQIRIAEATQ